MRHTGLTSSHIVVAVRTVNELRFPEQPPAERLIDHLIFVMGLPVFQAGDLFASPGIPGLVIWTSLARD